MNGVLELDKRPEGTARYSALDKWNVQLSQLQKVIINKMTWKISFNMILRDINKHVVKLVFSIRISVLFFLRENDVGSFELCNFLFLFLMFAEYFCTSRKIYRAGITVLIIIKKWAFFPWNQNTQLYFLFVVGRH